MAGLKIGNVVGDFEIVRELGRGGMGAVYEAQDQMLGRRVAIKVVHQALSGDPMLNERFQKEAQALARLKHPNVTSVHSLFREDDEFFLVMEFVDGESLEARLRRQGALSWKEAVRLTSAALEGLQHAHEHGIIHRDIKPANLLLPADGGIKIMDFGIARILGQEGLTQTGMIVGTVAYMSPEQIGGRELTIHTDLYSMGVVLYQMIAGRLPFSVLSDYELMRAQVEQTPPPARTFAPKIPQWLEKVLAKSLAKAPKDRHHLAAEFAADLRHGLETSTAVEAGATHILPASPRPAPPPPRPAPPPHPPLSVPTGDLTLVEVTPQPTPKRRSPVVPLAIAGLLALCAMLAGLMLRPAASEPAGPPPIETPDTIATVPSAPPTTATESPAPVAPASQSTPTPRASGTSSSSPPQSPPRQSPASQPSASQPSASQPSASQPSASQPSASQPSAPPGPSRLAPEDPDEAFLKIGEIAKRLPKICEQLMDHYEEYLEDLEDRDESKMKSQDWPLYEQIEEFLDLSERLRSAYNVAAEREGKSQKRGIQKFATRVRSKLSSADRNTVRERIDEMKRDSQHIQGLMRQANSDDLTRSLWRKMWADILLLEHLKSTASS